MRKTTLVLAVVLLVAGCESTRALRQAVVGATPHERYAGALRDAGLDDTALGEAWARAAEHAVARATSAPLPFRETGFFAAEEPAALAWRFSVPRGQRLAIALDVAAGEQTRIFMDLFELPRDTTDDPRVVAYSSPESRELEYEPRRDAELVLRIQPELLRNVRFTVEARTGATLAFPVDGRDTRAIGSRFGDTRDGGRRDHHGVDIFAPRGTPVLAASDGIVRSVGTNRLGGNVIWVADQRRGISQYYAHLDTQLVAAGTRVRAGDTLGLVGNTGNARTTPPHLHFGIYASRRGPVDPWPFLHTPAQTPARVTADTGRLGNWARSRQAQPVPVRIAPGDRAVVTTRLARHTPMRVLGASGSWYRVELPDGTAGYVAASATEPARSIIATHPVAAAAAVLDRPTAGAVPMDSVSAGSTVRVIGRYAGYLMIDHGDGRSGWLAE